MLEYLALWEDDQPHVHFERNNAMKRLVEALRRDTPAVHSRGHSCQAIKLNATCRNRLAPLVPGKQTVEPLCIAEKTMWGMEETRANPSRGY